MSYTYDVFISYVNAAPVGPWVRRCFEPTLSMYLSEDLGREARVFVDRTMPTGAAWRDVLGDALQRSRCLVGIWSPRYFFDSPWCEAEWRSMLDRDAATGRGRGTTVPSTIFPVVVRDGDRFPPDASELVYDGAAMHDFLLNAEDFPRHARFVDFEVAIKDLSERLAERVESAPPWQPDWPTLRSPPVASGRRAFGGPPRIEEVE